MSRAAVIDVVRAGRRFLVTGHRRPDADALGSALGWAAILRALGKEALVFSVDPAPPTLRYLEAASEIVSEPTDGPWDACFVMDAAAAALHPPMPASLAGPVVVIDHHSAHDDAGDVVCREPDACATGVLVLRLLTELGLSAVPAAAAAPLYAAIVADTGGFRYAGTDPETFRMAAALVEAGAEPWPTARHLFEAWAPAKMRLLGAVLERMEVVLEGRLAVLRVTRAMLRASGADDAMVEGMVSYGRMLEGVEVSLLVWELEPAADADPITKVSLRASGAFDVSSVAQAFGGGGHRAAAGASVRRALEPTVSAVRAELARRLEG